VLGQAKTKLQVWGTSDAPPDMLVLIRRY